MQDYSTISSMKGILKGEHLRGFPRDDPRERWGPWVGATHWEALLNASKATS